MNMTEHAIKMISRVIYSIDRFTDLIGRGISWLTVAMVIAVLIIVVTRYYLQLGSIAMQELVTYLHATVFMLGIGYTLKKGGHVRVDIFYRQYSPRKKALVDFLGGLLFLLPVSGLIFLSSWDYVLASWSIRETSAENNGLPFVFLLKTLILLMPATLFLQGISEMLKPFLALNDSSHLDRKDGVSAIVKKRDLKT